MDLALLPINDRVDADAAAFAARIVMAIGIISPQEKVRSDCDEVANSNGTEKANIYNIETKYGVVRVFPGFNKNGHAVASTWNRGLLYYMEAEGFDASEIYAAKLNGELRENTPDNVDILALFLTNDFGLQEQKGMAIL